MGSDQLEEARPLTDVPGKPGLIRAFLALPLPEARRAELSRFMAACAARAPEFRWVAESNLHLTIRFLGSVDAMTAHQLGERLIGLPIEPFRLQLGELGMFQRGRLVRVVWAGLATGADAARGLAGLVEDECARSGLEPEKRLFQAHLTLARARAREGAPKPELPELPRLEAWTADELVLYQSHLGRGGAVYEPLVRVALGG